MVNGLRTFRKTDFSAALALMVASVMFGALARADSFTVTNPPSTRKVLPDVGEARPGSGNAGPKVKTLRIAMARGEYEPVQIVVHAGDKPLQRVRVSVSNLVGPNGSALPQEQITVNPLGSVKCTKQSFRSRLLTDRGGQVPDVLLPDRPMDVPKDHRQSYFITVRTLLTDRAGEYHATVRISAAGEKTKERPLVVRVYDVVLPVKSHLRTAFGMDVGYRKIEGADPGRDMASLLRYSKVLLQHRVSPCIFGYSRSKTNVPPMMAEDRTWDFSGTDIFLSELVPLGLTSFYTHAGAGVPAYVNHLKKRGWGDLGYVYMFDEAPMKELPKMRNQYSSMRHWVPDANIMQVGWSPANPLKGLVNMWCPTIDAADTGALREARERGEEAWWYTWGGPWRPHPTICHIDYPGIYGRITGWMSYHYGIQGFLYFAVDIWDTPKSLPPGGRLSVDEYDRANYANWKANTYGKTSYGYPRNGGGYLLYPGKGNTPIPSMRLAHVRDGFEDYDLFVEAEALAVGDSKAAGRVRELLDFSTPFESPLIVSRKKWTKVDNLLMERREEILMIAEELRQPDNPQLKALRQKTIPEAIYPLPVEDKRESAFGKTIPGKAHYVDGKNCLNLLPKLRSVGDLPLDGWLFKKDPDRIGTDQGYYKPDYPTGDLARIKIGEHWDGQGYGDLVEGWYRLRYTCPELPKGKRVFLHFGAVDESAWLYVDGKLAAWYDTAFPQKTWNTPFLLEVTGSLKSQGEHMLAIRVRNIYGAGGIYKPVSLMVEK